MSLPKAIDDLKFDTRMKEWNLRTGKVTKQEIEQGLASLEDCSANVQQVNLDDAGSALDALDASAPSELN